MKTNLIKVFGHKEVIFWKRTWGMHKKFDGAMKAIGFPIALLLSGVFHYIFAIAHFLFECVLWAVLRDQFKANLIKLQTIT